MAAVAGVLVLAGAAVIAVLLRAALRDPSRVDKVLFFASPDSAIAERWRVHGRGLFFVWAALMVFGLLIGGLSLLA